MSLDLRRRNNWQFYILITALSVFYLWAIFLSFHPKVTEEYKAHYIDKTTDDWKPKHYIATLEDGIDFSRDGWPTFINSTHGFSHHESWGRWLDAKLLPAAKIVFAEAFTGYVCLELKTVAPITQLGKAVIVRMAGEQKKFFPSTTDSEIHKIEFLLGKPTAVIEVEPTAPVAPREWGSSYIDPRKIGLGLLKLGIATRPCGLRDRDEVGFAEGQAGVSMLADGWSKPESWGVWGIGDHSALSLRLSSDEFQSTDVSLRVTVRAFLPPGIDSKGVKVFLGEPTGADPLAQWKLTTTSEEKELCISATAIPRDRLIKLTFQADHSYSPAEAAILTDSRVLNIALQSLSVHSERCSGLRDRDEVGFAEGQAGVSMLADGWSKPESWGVWGIGDHSALSLRLSSDEFQSTDVSLRVTVRAFLPPGIDSKGIKVFLGEPTGADPLAQWKLTTTSEEKELCISATAIPRDRLIKLTFQADHSYSPAEAAILTDRRVLNIALQSLSVHSERCSGLRDRDEVGFAEGQAGVSMLADGWSKPESWGVWGIGDHSALSLRLSSDEFQSTDVSLRVTVRAFLPPGIDSKGVKVFLGEPTGADPLAQWKLTTTSEEKELCISATAIPRDRLIKLTFQADHSYSPAEAAILTDSRVLNIALQSLSVHSERCSGLRDRDEVGFAEGQAGVSMLADGWSKPESWGVWGIGDHSALSLRLSSDEFQSTDVSLRVTVRAFLPPGIDSKGVKVFLGEPTGADLLAQWKLTTTSEEKELCISATAIPRDRLIKLTFQAYHSYSPAEAAILTDSRVLNIALQSLSVHSERCSSR